jgi:hypothetical protein
VVVGGRRYTSDAAGQVRLAEGASFGTFVDVVAPGFVDRQTLLRSDALTRLALWPRGNALGIDDWYTAAIVYSDSSGAAGAAPLRRLPAQTRDVVLVLSEAIANDDGAREQHDFSASLLTEAAQGRIRYALSRQRPTAGVFFEVRVDPSDVQCAPRVLAYTSVTLAGSEITGGRIVYCQLSEARTSVATHELGHTFGLRHSPDGGEIMTGTIFGGRYAPDRYSAREQLIMLLMLERRAGNRFPDNDREVRTSASREETIVCR